MNRRSIVIGGLGLLAHPKLALTTPLQLLREQIMTICDRAFFGAANVWLQAAGNLEPVPYARRLIALNLLRDTRCLDAWEALICEQYEKGSLVSHGDWIISEAERSLIDVLRVIDELT